MTFKLIGNKIFDTKPGHGIGPMVATGVPDSIKTDEQAAEWMEHRGEMNYHELMDERKIMLQKADEWPLRSPDRQRYLDAAQDLHERAEGEL